MKKEILDFILREFEYYDIEKIINIKNKRNKKINYIVFIIDELLKILKKNEYSIYKNKGLYCFLNKKDIVTLEINEMSNLLSDIAILLKYERIDAIYYKFKKSLIRQLDSELFVQ